MFQLDFEIFSTIASYIKISSMINQIFIKFFMTIFNTGDC